MFQTGFVGINLTIKPNNNIYSDNISLANIKPQFPITQNQKEYKSSLILTVIACSLSRSRVSSSIMILTERKRERDKQPILANNLPSMSV